MSTQDKLVDLFASKPCAAVQEADLRRLFLADEFADLQALPDYNETFRQVQKAKLKIEGIAERYPDKVDQALQCLAELKRRRRESKYLTETFKVTRDLIGKTLYKDWNGLQAGYDLRRQVIENWNDVFVSYTNRDAFPTNQRYASLILHEWGIAVDPKATKENYVARTIAKYLEQNNMKGFVDYNVLQCGDDIANEILQHSARSIALIQLLEPVTFQEPLAPLRNWCREEYHQFIASGVPRGNLAEKHNRCFFVLARADTIEEILPVARPREYQGWMDRAMRDLRLTLNAYVLPFEDLRADVKNVARQIDDAREKLLDAMLGSMVE